VSNEYDPIGSRWSSAKNDDAAAMIEPTDAKLVRYFFAKKLHGSEPLAHECMSLTFQRQSHFCGGWSRYFRLDSERVFRQPLE
jgi:hypothetical protein